MPLVSWFTRPARSFASYYFYDTTTRQLIRIRLELGRDSAPTPAENATFISNDGSTVVGFGKNGLSGPKEVGGKGKWSVDDGHRLCFDGTPLHGPPPKNLGDGIYDAGDVPGTVNVLHSGNPVTAAPELPPGIKPEYLALLAQETIIDKTPNFILTEASDTPGALAEAIKDAVLQVLRVDAFGDVTDDLIHAKLIAQARDIATLPARKSLENFLRYAQDWTTEISGKLTEGTTPDRQLETDFSKLQSALKDAAATTQEVDVKETRANIATALEAMKTALEGMGANASEDLTGAKESLSQAMGDAEESATTWQAVETSYKNKLAAIDSVDQYMSTLSDGI